MILGSPNCDPTSFKLRLLFVVMSCHLLAAATSFSTICQPEALAAKDCPKLKTQNPGGPLQLIFKEELVDR
jgi:hypothetical protein